MTPSSIESRIRARLPAARFIQEYLPLRLLGWLSKQGAAPPAVSRGYRTRSCVCGGRPGGMVHPPKQPAR